MITSDIARLQRTLDEFRADLAQALMLGQSRHSLLVRLKSRGISDENANLLLDEAQKLVDERKRASHSR